MSVRVLHPAGLPVLAGALLLGACATPSQPTPPAPPPSAPTSPTPERAGSERPAGRADPQSAPAPKAGDERAKSSAAERGAESAKAPPAERAASAPAPAPTSAPPSVPASPGGGPATTAEEDEAAWDKRFQDSLGDFDRRLARDQAEIEKQRQAVAAAGNTGAAGGADGGSRDGSAAGMPPEMPSAEPGEAEAAQNTSAGGYGTPTAGPRFPAPADVPDGKDDDVVARQLREAAETEKDPALRARLWEEYRKYKSR